MLTPYRSIFAIPGALRFSLSGLIGRMPISMVWLAIIFVIVEKTDSYALAGALSTLAAITAAISSPIWSRAADRYGQRKVLSLSVPLSVTTLFIFIQAVNHNLPRWSWFCFVILMESVFVGLGQMVRRRWTHVLGDNRNLINAAFSFEALADEVIFTFGPIIATLVATTISPTAAVYTCMGFLLVGGTIFLTSTGTEPPAATHREKSSSRAILSIPIVRAIVISYFFVGAFFSSVNLTTIGYADDYHHKSLTGILVAVWSIGSGIAAFINGSIHWRISDSKRYVLFVALLGLLAIPLYIAALVTPGNLFTMGIALFLNGFAIAPLLVAGYSVVEKNVPDSQVTEALGWSLSALIIGNALPAFTTGKIIDSYGAAPAYVIPIFCMAAAFAVMIKYQGTWRNP